LVDAPSNIKNIEAYSGSIMLEIESVMTSVNTEVKKSRFSRPKYSRQPHNLNLRVYNLMKDQPGFAFPRFAFDNMWETKKPLNFCDLLEFIERHIECAKLDSCKVDTFDIVIATLTSPAGIVHTLDSSVRQASQASLHTLNKLRGLKCMFEASGDRMKTWIHHKLWKHDAAKSTVKCIVIWKDHTLNIRYKRSDDWWRAPFAQTMDVAIENVSADDMGAFFKQILRWGEGDVIQLSKTCLELLNPKHVEL
jgi:hypothetical protein